jgi:glycosyltransferase involved in cell wall biosynthesis
MSYQREPSINQIKRAYQLSKNNTLAFSGCSDYISNQIKTVAEAYTVYNGVDLNSYDFNDKIKEDAPLVFLGRIEEIKGTHVAIEMALKTNNRLIIAGNIPAEYELYFNDRVKPFLSEQIQYIGPVNDVQKNTMLREAKAFLMPIQWNEPFGIVMAEAMACGTPVIGFNRGSVPEVVEQGETGFVCNTNDEFADAVNKISQINRADVRKAAENRFSADVISNNYIALYQKLINR